MKIYWSNAPEWANVFLGPACDSGNFAWAESFSDKALFSYECGKVPTCRLNLYGYHNWKLISERPVAQEWNGTGLPPVGVACDFMWNYRLEGSEYVQARVLTHDDGAAIVRLLGGNSGALRESRGGDCRGHPIFRPIKTPEQIAADEREAVISEMVRTIKGPGYISRIQAAQLYAAGYRKTEEAKS